MRSSLYTSTKEFNSRFMPTETMEDLFRDIPDIRSMVDDFFRSQQTESQSTSLPPIGEKNIQPNPIDSQEQIESPQQRISCTADAISNALLKPSSATDSSRRTQRISWRPDRVERLRNLAKTSYSRRHLAKRAQEDDLLRGATLSAIKTCCCNYGIHIGKKYDPDRPTSLHIT